MRNENIAHCDVTNKIFKRNRWHVNLKPAFFGLHEMPLANYNWLIGNPAFIKVPTGYVIHHLDHNELNDDISNLALMQKHHHAAHHWKQKTVDTEILIDGYQECAGIPPSKRTSFIPTKEPVIYKRKDAVGYRVCFGERINGKSRYVKLSAFRGKTLKTIQDAEWAKKAIWGESLGQSPPKAI